MHPESKDSWGLRLLRGTGRLMLCIPRPLGFVLPVLWAASIYWVSSQRVPFGLPAFGLLPLLGNLFHAFEFGVLLILCLPMLPRRAGWVDMGGRGLRYIMVPCTLAAFGDELHQSFVPGRSASLLDFGTDFVGILASIVIVRMLGDPTLSQRTLFRSIGVGILCCLAAATVTTLWDTYLWEGPWPFPVSSD